MKSKLLWALLADGPYISSRSDGKGVVHRLSAEFERLTGWSPDQWLGKGAIRSFTRTTSSGSFRRKSCEGGSWLNALRMVTKSGEYRRVEVCTYPFIGSGWQGSARIRHCRDMTEYFVLLDRRKDAEVGGACVVRRDGRYCRGSFSRWPHHARAVHPRRHAALAQRSTASRSAAPEIENCYRLLSPPRASHASRRRSVLENRCVTSFRMRSEAKGTGSRLSIRRSTTTAFWPSRTTSPNVWRWKRRFASATSASASLQRISTWSSGAARSMAPRLCQLSLRARRRYLAESIRRRSQPTHADDPPR